jgi:Pleckstrin homology domain
MAHSLGNLVLSTIVLTYSGGWKARILNFGKDEGYTQAALGPYVQKTIGHTPSAEKAAAASDNAAHATVTGAGLLFVKKSKGADAPARIINLVNFYESRSNCLRLM